MRRRPIGFVTRLDRVGSAQPGHKPGTQTNREEIMPRHHAARYLPHACVLLGLTFAAAALAAPPLGTEAPGHNGKVVINDRGVAKVHTFAFSPGSSTTHIIETADGLVVIDAQMTIPDAREAVAYVRSLNKPIRRLIVSHAHPDHWLGLAEWGEVPSFSIADVRTFINGEDGTQLYRGFKEGIPPYRKLGDALSARKGTIASELPAREKIIGLDFIYERVLDGEADVQLVVKIPEIKTLVVQDLVYNNMHHFIGQNRLAADALPAFDGWIAAMRRLRRENADAELLLVGHGLATSPRAIDETIAYLTKAKEVFPRAKNGDELRQLMEAAFPGLDGIRYINISAGYLYRKP
jgi:glyoxylase-like metal-dependent hydrolase (beta-lactamase superfamily II)